MNPSGSERFRKDRLIQMVDLAQVYRGCSKSELASMLDRDPAKIVPDSGNPKLDLVFNLADILDWPVGDVAEALWGRHQSRMHGGPERPAPSGTFVEIDQRAREAHRRGDYREMLWLGERLLEMAESSRERACAMTRIAGAWHGEGRFVKSLECFQAALAERDVEPRLSRMMRANLASAHLALWNLDEAESLADALVREYEASGTDDRSSEVSLAHAYFIAGTARARRIPTETRTGNAQSVVLDSKRCLIDARRQFEKLADVHEDSSYSAIAQTCRAFVLEMDVELGLCEPMTAIRQLLDELDQVVDPATVRGNQLENWGWWCVSGLNIVLRHLQGDVAQRHAAIFSNKAFELADATGSWPLRERAFYLSFVASQVGESPQSNAVRSVLDEEDLRLLVGAMGRFPRFRNTGWRMLAVAMGHAQ